MRLITLILACAFLVQTMHAQADADTDISRLLKEGLVKKAVSSVSTSSDADDWKALQDWLLLPESRKLLATDAALDPYVDEIRAKELTLERLLRQLAEGNPELAGKLFVAVEEQLQKSNTASGAKGTTLPVYYGGIARMQKPTKVVMDLLKLRVQQSGTQQQHTDDRVLANTLAIMGTRQSADLLAELLGKSGKHGWDSPFWFDQKLFGLNRHRYEICRMVLDYIKGRKGKGKQPLFDMLFEDKFVPVGCSANAPECIKLPTIAPKGEEAKKYIELLDGFLKDSGSYKMTDEQRQKMQALVESIKKTSAEKD